MGAKDGEDSKVQLNPTVDFIAGTIAGMTSLAVGYPFDTVKVRFQSPEIAGKYRSTFHAITTIIREERFVGLFKGIASPFTTAPLMNGIVFASYRFLLKVQLPTVDSVPTLSQIALAGAGTGIVGSFLVTPVEHIKVRQQACLTPTSTRQIALQIFREGGIPALYRGITATALRDTGYGAYFVAYEATCRYFSSPTRPPEPNILGQVETQMTEMPWSTLLLAGALAGIAGWIVTFPFDVVKTRMQGGEGAGAPPKPTDLHPSTTTPLVKQDGNSRDCNPYRTTMSTIIHSYRTEGIGVFFRGLAPTLIRAIPVNMVTFATFEAVVHMMS
ncbi:carnitine/acyl carnitine carrier [Gymnopilus junonius]|uniref:Carnitine/acyl carnitine carrier n=1 Tax=Gymnopilus junonius TaxID=109634 RepID=A0A9P5TSM1_GYMJU|nr:carnitine/acyl carnitine carrier [Gymnopilus junonius]